MEWNRGWVVSLLNGVYVCMCLTGWAGCLLWSNLYDQTMIFDCGEKDVIHIDLIDRFSNAQSETSIGIGATWEAIGSCQLKSVNLGILLNGPKENCQSACVHAPATRSLTNTDCIEQDPAAHLLWTQAQALVSVCEIPSNLSTVSYRSNTTTQYSPRQAAWVSNPTPSIVCEPACCRRITTIGHSHPSGGSFDLIVGYLLVMFYMQRAARIELKNGKASRGTREGERPLTVRPTPFTHFPEHIVNHIRTVLFAVWRLDRMWSRNILHNEMCSCCCC